MKKYLILLATVIIWSTTMGQKVTSDHDKEVDFRKFKSYSFLGWQNDSDQILNDLDKKRLRDSFSEEFKKRGLTAVEDNSDMVVTIYVVADLKTSTTAYTNYYGGGRGRYRRGGWGWGSGHSTTVYSENDYLQGTLVLDVYDTQSESLVWQGVATKAVSDPKKREKNIPKVVKKLMKKFPIETL